MARFYFYYPLPPIPYSLVRGEWWNGRHEGLKIPWVNSPCEFESHLAHQIGEQYMLDCNLETAQRWRRIAFGLVLLVLAYGAHTYSYGRVFQWGLGLGGILVLFEGLKGWCALKALGLKIPF